MGLWYWFRLFLLGAVLASTGWLGITDGWRADPATAGQRIAVASQLAYGVLGLVGFIALLARWRYTMPVVILWAVATTLTAALAPVVWGEAPMRVAAFTGAVTAGIAALVVWGASAHLLRSPFPRDPEAGT